MDEQNAYHAEKLIRYRDRPQRMYVKRGAHCSDVQHVM